MSVKSTRGVGARVRKSRPDRCIVSNAQSARTVSKHRAFFSCFESPCDCGLDIEWGSTGPAFRVVLHARQSVASKCYWAKANQQYINCATGNILNHTSLCYWIRRIDSASIMLLDAKFTQQYTIVLLEAKATRQWANQQYTDCATGREVYSTVHHCATEGKVHKGTLTSALSVPGTTKASESRRRPRDLRGGCLRDTRVRNAIRLPALAVPPIVD